MRNYDACEQFVSSPDGVVLYCMCAANFGFFPVHAHNIKCRKENLIQNSCFLDCERKSLGHCIYFCKPTLCNGVMQYYLTSTVIIYRENYFILLTMTNFMDFNLLSSLLNKTPLSMRNISRICRIGSLLTK